MRREGGTGEGGRVEGDTGVPFQRRPIYERMGHMRQREHAHGVWTRERNAQQAGFKVTYKEEDRVVRDMRGSWKSSKIGREERIGHKKRLL